MRVFHAGTRLSGGHVVSAGGRVLTVVGEGTTFRDAMSRAYAGVDAIRFDGAFARSDIGKKALHECRSAAVPPRTVAPQHCSTPALA